MVSDRTSDHFGKSIGEHSGFKQYHYQDLLTKNHEIPCLGDPQFQAFWTSFSHCLMATNQGTPVWFKQNHHSADLIGSIKRRKRLAHVVAQGSRLGSCRGRAEVVWKHACVSNDNIPIYRNPVGLETTGNESQSGSPFQVGMEMIHVNTRVM